MNQGWRVQLKVQGVHVTSATDANMLVSKTTHVWSPRVKMVTPLLAATSVVSDGVFSDI